jgi:hypothetical protein
MRSGFFIREAVYFNQYIHVAIAKKQTIVSTVKHNWGTYTISLDQTVMGKYIYVNYAKTTRVPNSVVNKN